MLVELMVEQYAVIEKLRVRFHDGFQVLTGETGSGKSIVVDALGLLFGGRASAEMIRTGAERARVAGIFNVESIRGLRPVLDVAGITLEDDELMIEREILAGGKSRAFVSNRPVTAALLRDIAPWLGDIHGQHDQQRLFDKSEQLAMLDDFAQNASFREAVATRFASLNQARQELVELDRTEQERLRLADLWSFQVNEIDNVAPKAGEDESLEHERRLLQNVTRLQEQISGAYDAVYESPQSAVAQTRAARKRVEDARRVDATLDVLIETLVSAETQLQEAGYALRDYLGKLEADPARLDVVESRLAALDKLKRKYGPDLATVLKHFETTRAQLEGASSAGARRAELARSVDRLTGEYEKDANRLTESRRKASARIEQAVEKELAALAMERTKFRVGFASCAPSPNGVDTVEFLISPNVGEEPKPLDRIASGGELSRVALALKTALQSAGPSGPRRTLVFDEVDAGIGGRVAEAVGKRLRQLAGSNQVLCVTHLAQIAGFASHQFSVEKVETNGRTVATIQELDKKARIEEIGRMLSGRLTPEALKHAAELLKRN